MNPNEMLEKYRELLSAIGGKDIARESECYYIGGWFYINIAKKFGDGSIGVLGIPSCYRKKELLKMIEKRSLFEVREDR